MGGRLHRIGLIPAWLALCGQILLGMALPPRAAEASLAELLAGGGICHGAPATPGHSTADCGLCPICVMLAAPACLPEMATDLPSSRGGVIGLVVASLPAAPGRPPVLPAAQARGPPSV